MIDNVEPVKGATVVVSGVGLATVGERVQIEGKQCVIFHRPDQTIYFPVASLATLYWQLSQFGPLGLVQTILITAAAAVFCLFGLLSIRSIAALRQTPTEGAEPGTLP